jgi:hypothetical protein
MARAKFGTKGAEKSASEFAELFNPVLGGIFSVGRAIGRVAGKDITDDLLKRLISETKGKAFLDQLFPTTVRVMVKQKKAGGGFSRIVDEIKGLNTTHALQRAEANWPGSQISLLNKSVKKP